MDPLTIASLMAGGAQGLLGIRNAFAGRRRARGRARSERARIFEQIRRGQIRQGENNVDTGMSGDLAKLRLRRAREGGENAIRMNEQGVGDANRSFVDQMLMNGIGVGATAAGGLAALSGPSRPYIPASTVSAPVTQQNANVWAFLDDLLK